MVFCICAAVSVSSARLSIDDLLSAFVFLFTYLSRIKYLVCSSSCTRCDFVSSLFFFVSCLSSVVFHVSVFIHSSSFFLHPRSVLLVSVSTWSKVSIVISCSLAVHGIDSSV